MLVAPAVPPPVTIDETRTVGASFRAPTAWQLAVWICDAVVVTAIGVWLLRRWLNPRR